LIVRRRKRNGEWNGFAVFLPPGKIPQIGKSCALTGLYRLNRTGSTFKKNALLVRLFDQGKAAPIGSQAGVGGEEFVLRNAEMSGYGGAFLFLDVDVPRPAAAISASLALIENSWWRRNHRDGNTFR
jgi:hypothetical protein